MGYILLPASGKQKLTDFSIQPSGPQQGRIQGVRSVRSHDHFNSVQSVKSIHLIQQLTGNRTLVSNNPKPSQLDLFSCLSIFTKMKSSEDKLKKILQGLKLPEYSISSNEGLKRDTENALPREKDIEQS